MLILDRERQRRRGKGQANTQVSFEAAKRETMYVLNLTHSLIELHLE